MSKQHPLPDYLKIPSHMSARMKPELRRQFRKFLKLLRRIEKKREARDAKEKTERDSEGP